MPRAKKNKHIPAMRGSRRRSSRAGGRDCSYLLNGFRDQNFARRYVLMFAMGLEPSPALLENRYGHGQKADGAHQLPYDL